MHTEALHKQNLNTEELLQTETGTQRNFHKQKLLHTEDVLLRNFCTQKLLRKNTFTQRSFYSQMLLHTENLMQTSFCTEKSLPIFHHVSFFMIVHHLSPSYLCLYVLLVNSLRRLVFISHGVLSVHASSSYISTSKSGPDLVCFVHFDFDMCFAPQLRALFRHLNFQKWSENAVLCTF